jgi:hypothetical protein
MSLAPPTQHGVSVKIKEERIQPKPTKPAELEDEVQIVCST